jgi:hypothetical protein
MEFYVAVFLFQATVVGLFCAWIAQQKRRNALNWFVLGLLFNLIALIALIAVPNSSEEKAKTLVFYKGTPIISSDDYRIFLIERFAIKHNPMLNLYSNAEGQAFKSLEKAIELAHCSYLSELEAQTKKQEEAEASRKRTMQHEKKQLLFGSAFWLLFFVGCAIYWLMYSA